MTIIQDLGLGLATGIIWAIIRCYVPSKWTYAVAYSALGMSFFFDDSFPSVSDGIDLFFMFLAFAPAYIITERKFRRVR